MSDGNGTHDAQRTFDREDAALRLAKIARAVKRKQDLQSECSSLTAKLKNARRQYDDACQVLAHELNMAGRLYVEHSPLLDAPMPTGRIPSIIDGAPVEGGGCQQSFAGDQADDDGEMPDGSKPAPRRRKGKKKGGE